MKKVFAALSFTFISSFANASLFTLNFEATVDSLYGNTSLIAGNKVGDKLTGHFTFKTQMAGSDAAFKAGTHYEPGVEWISSSIDQFSVFERSTPDVISPVIKANKDFVDVLNNASAAPHFDTIELSDREEDLGYRRIISIRGDSQANPVLLSTTTFSNEILLDALVIFANTPVASHINGSQLYFQYTLSSTGENLNGTATITSLSSPAPVPLPGAARMFLTAVLGGGAIARKRKSLQSRDM